MHVEVVMVKVVMLMLKIGRRRGISMHVPIMLLRMNAMEIQYWLSRILKS